MKSMNATMKLALTVTLTVGIRSSMYNRVTLSDVARQAGVSLMTVSRVIRNRGGARNETRQNVLETISYRLHFDASFVSPVSEINGALLL